MNEYIFMTVNNEIITPVSVTFDKNNSFYKLTGYTGTNTTIRTFMPSEYKCLENHIDIPGIGTLHAGDLIKINAKEEHYYELGFGWYTTNEGLDLFGWYLFKDNIVKPFYKNYIDTVEVVKFVGKDITCNCNCKGNN